MLRVVGASGVRWRESSKQNFNSVWDLELPSSCSSVRSFFSTHAAVAVE